MITTLDDMLIETAGYCDETISKVNGSYTSDSLVIVDKLVSPLNYALNKIVKEKIKLEYIETITLDADRKFDLSTLTKNMLQILSVQDSEDPECEFNYMVNADSLYVPSGLSGDSYKLKYNYLPAELSTANLTGVPELPTAVDIRIPCYYAAYFFLANGSDERANIFLDLWNDGFTSIKPSKKILKKIQEDEGWWG